MIKKYSKFLEIIPITNEQKAGFRIILQFPQRYFWGIRVPQKYLYVISVLGTCLIGNDVTDYHGLSKPF
jgi:hypothetical protein